jgi:type IV pilus assembly protein PilB
VERLSVGQILVRSDALKAEQVPKVLEFAKSNGVRFGEACLKLELCTEEQVFRALARHFQIPFANLAGKTLPPELIDLVPKEVATENRIVPVAAKDGRITVAIADPTDFFVIQDNLRFLLNREVSCALATPRALDEALDHHYRLSGDLSGVINEAAESQDAKIAGSGSEEELDANDAPIIRLVQFLISTAIKERASDIHVEPMADRVRIRYRIDGVCQDREPYPKKLQGPIISRIKIMSRMDMAEKRRPQDGRIMLKMHGREIDFRVSALPGTHGESVVMRILDKEKALVDLEELGFHETDFQRFERVIKRPTGIFLVTGPTGSGKTTTLYAALKRLNRPDVKIITAENPVEYCISGINQSEVKHEIGLDFQRIIRAMMRQAPNIILVGEIRDSETADIAIQAALTGHLVFSTLHTNDAPSAITRLIDMGVKPFLVASAIMAVMGQRLIRVLCPKCKEPYEPQEVEVRQIGLTVDQLQGQPLYRAVGCPECRFTGYHGRKGIFELMEMSPDLREMAFHKRPTMEIRSKARSEGMVTLQEDGVRKITGGTASIDDVLRVTHSSEFVTQQ